MLTMLATGRITPTVIDIQTAPSVSAADHVNLAAALAGAVTQEAA